MPDKIENKNGVLFVKVKSMETKEVTVKGKKYFEIRGLASTFGNVDLGDDICAKGCFTDSLKERMPKVLWQHSRYEPIGIITEAYEKDEGLYIRVLLPIDDTFVKGRVLPQVEAGSVDSFSIGYSVVEASWNNDTDVRTLIKVNLWEVSLVTFPMNPLAKIEAMKEFKQFYAGNAKVEIIMKSDFTIADISHKWNAEEAKARLEGKELPDLPVFDVIDKKTVVVPRAMFALKAQLIGARGGYDGDEVVAKEFLNKYYEKMNLEAPFIGTAAFCETEINNLQKSELSYILRNGKLSKSCADSVAGKVLATDTKPDETGNEKAIKSISDDIKKRTQKLNTK